MLHPTFSQQQDDDDGQEDEISLTNFDDGSPPIPDDPVSSADTLIAKELANLSMKQREQVYFDVHGVSDGVVETEEQIQISLQQMDKELLIASPYDKIAYLLALQQNPSYVQNDTFRLRFLRAERFDAEAAAKRYLKHFKVKLELFGEEMLTKDVTQDDLSPEDLNVVYHSAFYCMPVKNAAGRLVIFYKSPSIDLPLMSIIRRGFYVCMSFTDDEETQKKGCVMISYLFGHSFTYEEISKRREINQRYGEVLSSLPLRVETVHMCMDTYIWRPFLAVFKLTLGMFTRLRCREHYGNHQQVVFSLQTHGIPKEFVEASIVSTNANERYWRRRRELERRRLSIKEKRAGALRTPSPACNHADIDDNIDDDDDIDSVVEVPNSNDVLLGRGKTNYSHIGNVRFRNLIVEYGACYEGAQSRKEKTRVSQSIVQMIRDKKGRFLRDDSYGWVEVDDSVARDKVTHAFRTLRSLLVSPTGKADSSTNGEDGQSRPGATVETRKRVSPSEDA